MIKKFFLHLSLILFVPLIILIITLSTIGVETSKFNNLISDKISETKNIKLELKTIIFKLDLRELSLFLETKQPKIEYNNLLVPARNIRVYIDFLNLLQTNLRINKINLSLKELDIIQLNKLSKFIKPSNFKSILNNKIKNGKLISEIEIFLNNERSLENYIIKGNVFDLEANIYDNLNLSKTKFSFFADKDDILIKNIFGNIDNIKIKDGDIKFNLEDAVKINSNFNTDINLNSEFLKRNKKLLENLNINHEIKFIIGNLNHNVSFDFDSTFKLINYDYKFSGNIRNSQIKLNRPFKNNLISEEIKKIFFKDMQITSNVSSNSFNFDAGGKYSLDNIDFFDLKFNNDFKNDSLNLKANLDFKNKLEFSFINYKKPKNIIANLLFEFNKKKDLYKIKNLKYKEKDNYFKISNLSYKKDKLISFNKIEVKTPNNNFFINWNKKILIKGNKFDATNIPKVLNNQNVGNDFKYINSDIEINLDNIKAPLSENLQNFSLLGEIKKGKFVKISSKGDFGGSNFLDISMKKDKKTDKKFLEIYSDLPRPLLTEYDFFKGLSGGRLLFTSLIDGKKSNSKLKIENFKVIDAPGVIKLLSLADLGGLADLAEGEGLTFDTLEIDMEKNNDLVKLNEILALGPSMSVLMEGYQDLKGITSLKGTLVPAKTLNKLISKIPVIGDIVIPKEAGEGLFGISFKMKGPKGKMKTTINPIRTLTPRFIQKIVEKRGSSK